MPTAGPGPGRAARRLGRTPVAFIVGLAVSGVVALVALVALAVAARGQAVPTAIGLALAVIPIPVVLAGVLYLDRLEPEPPGLLAVTFAAGAAMAALAVGAAQVLGGQLITAPELGTGRLISTTLAAALGAAVVAETLKGAVLVALLRFRRQELDGTSDGVVYASVTGLGFTLVTSLYAYVRAEHTGMNALATAFVRRGLLAPLWGPLFTSLIGVGVSYAAMRRGRSGLWAVGAGWIAAIALHTLWNYSLTAGDIRLAIVYAILLAVLAALLAAVVADRRRIVALIKGYLPLPTAPDLATFTDVEMLASLRWRRLARHWARLHCGLAGSRAMADYQLAATELALICNRADRDLVRPAAFAARRDDSIALMRAAISFLHDRQPRLRQPPWAQLVTSVFGSSPGPVRDVPQSGGQDGAASG
jgi:RsiW-degrading membrane proteinase PrsW (M82 family)